MVNVDVLKTTVEEDLKEIKKAKIHILMIEEKNNELCEANNKEIERLNNVVKSRELSLEENLKDSGERKIETSAGWCAYRVMPDSWEYDTKILIEWAKSEDAFKERYIKVTEEIRKDIIKKDIAEGFLVKELPGIKVTPQEPKFGYKLNGGL